MNSSDIIDNPTKVPKNLNDNCESFTNETILTQAEAEVVPSSSLVKFRLS